ncbi:MAG TPA: hypothetical protein VKQ28_10110 [Candidatus Acidoferrum sp.]|nr:hypothetical protein [Candidatus Acidoferrum sp.]
MKVSATLLSLALAATILAGLPAAARQDAGKKTTTASQKQAKWQGTVVRFSADKSSMDIHGGSAPSTATRTIAWDDSTQWTKGGKPGKQDEVKEGSFVIVLGKVDAKGVLHASRIDLRLPR